MLGDSYTVQMFLVDALRTVNEFVPYVLAAAVALGVVNFTIGAVISAVSMRRM